MGRYFGREPHYSQQEAEAQAKAAIDAAVNMGRPPDEQWKALGSRMGDINRELAARPPVDVLPPPPSRQAETERGDVRNAGRPRVVHQILRPPPAVAPEPTAPRRPVGPALVAPAAPSAAQATRTPRAGPAKGVTRTTPPATERPAAGPATRVTRAATAPAAKPATRVSRAPAAPPPAAGPVKRASRGATPPPAAKPATRVTRAPAPAPAAKPTKRSAGAPAPRATSAATRPATKKRPE